MVNVNLILSSVQNEINDIEMVRIQPGEYQDMFNQSLQQIAQATEMYVGRYSVVPNPSATPITVNKNVITIPEVDPITNNVLNPYRLYRVLRQDDTLSKFIETREYTVRAIASTYSGNRSFSGIQGVLDRNAFGSQFANPANNNLVDGSLTLIFTQDFALDEAVIIDFIQETPFTVTKWNDNPPFAVPEFMRPTVEALLLEKVSKRLFNKGDESFGTRFQMARQIAQSSLKELTAYVQNYKDKLSPQQAMPLDWLPETDYL